MKLLLVVLLLYGCSQNNESNDFSSDPDLKPLKNEVANFLGSNRVIIFGIDTIQLSDTLFALYRQRDFEPLWYQASPEIILKKDALKLYQTAHYLGIDTALFITKAFYDSTERHKLEILLTRNFLLLNTIAWHGATVTSDQNLDSLLSHTLLSRSFFEKTEWEFNDWKSTLEKHEPISVDYLRLKKQLANYIEKYEIRDTTFELADYKEDSVKLYDQAAQILNYYGYFNLEKKEDTAALKKAIKGYQHLNGLKSDAILGKYSKKALQKSHFDRWKQFAVNMERSKRLKIEEKEYIYVNIPSYTMRWVKSDTVFREHKVITGAFETQTPEFHAQMRSIVLYPTWHVPFSISTKEILPALRRDTNFLAKKGYTLHSPGGDSLSPYGIEWRKYSEKYFPYRIRQTGGKTNSLGVVKFLFPNKHSVYLHDTPGKYLFKNDIRAYSHGCIRLENPLEFGADLIARELDTNLVNSDSLKVLVDSAIQKVYTIRKDLMVYIDYRTIDPFNDKELVFLTDIYNRDEEWWNRMRYHAPKVKKEKQLASMP